MTSFWRSPTTTKKLRFFSWAPFLIRAGMRWSLYGVSHGATESECGRCTLPSSPYFLFRLRPRAQASTVGAFRRDRILCTDGAVTVKNVAGWSNQWRVRVAVADHADLNRLDFLRQLFDFDFWLEFPSEYFKKSGVAFRVWPDPRLSPLYAAAAQYEYEPKPCLDQPKLLLYLASQLSPVF